ncbi:MAG: hypothetical protein AAB229_07090 [Candidatus Hydrogenedentota bacterium]
MNSTRSLPATHHVTMGFICGFQLYSIVFLLPSLLKQLEESTSLNLAVLCAFLVLLFSQMELGRRLSMVSAAAAIRDCVIAQSIAFLMFVMAPQATFLLFALVAWMLAFSGTQIAFGRWTLLASEPNEREHEVRWTLVGFVAGIVAAKFITYQGHDENVLLYAGLAVSLAGSFLAYVFGRSRAGYTSLGQMWFYIDLRRDYPAQALTAASFCMGLMIGLLIFSLAHIAHAVVGVALFTLVSGRIFGALLPERASRYACYIAALALLADALFWPELVFGSVLLSFCAAVIYASVRLDGFNPRTLMSSGDRMALHNLGLSLGVTVEGLLSLPRLTSGEIMWATAFLLICCAYLISFLPDRTGRII